MKKIAILGCTGSIGTQTLDIVRNFPKDLSIVALSAGNNINQLNQLISEFKPSYAWCNNNELIKDPDVSIVDMVTMCELQNIDIVVVATSGIIGLEPTIAALKSGKIVALSNKEPIVVAGALLQSIEKQYTGKIYPVDSEPSAIWQCIGQNGDINKLIITGSGGSARDIPISALPQLTPEMALKHPNWSMGKKITIDSATMVNKAFEIIESRWLFDIPWHKLQAVIHPQSIVHSMVEFNDMSIKAIIGDPDMRVPIQYAIFYPDHRPNASFKQINFESALKLDFKPVDHDRYPAFSIIIDHSKLEGTYPAVLNIADEVAVDMYLKGQIKFTDIHNILGTIASLHTNNEYLDIYDLKQIMEWSWNKTTELCKTMSS
jgi:1-deoxy-D-xylulose-5-phosphate reductoisomerase